MPKCANPDCKTVDAEKEPNLRCGRCKHPSYCSKDCQRIHWPTHKPICNVLQSNPNALLAAAQTKNLHEIKILVSGGADVNYLYEEGATALFIAVATKQIRIVKFLVEDAKAQVNTQSKNGFTALHLAERAGAGEIAHYLLEQGALFLPGGLNPRTPFFIAASSGQLDIIKIFAESSEGKAQIDVPNNEGATPLYVEVEKNNIKVVRSLLLHRASAEGSPNGLGGQTPLWIAAHLGYRELVEDLIRAGAQIDRIINGKTPVYMAASSGYLDTTEFLISAKADFRKKGSEEDDFDPLWIAARNGRLGILSTLLNAYAWDPRPQEDAHSLMKAFFIACTMGQPKIAALLHQALREGLASFRKGIAPPWSVVSVAPPSVEANASAGILSSPPPSLKLSLSSAAAPTPSISPSKQGPLCSAMPSSSLSSASFQPPPTSEAFQPSLRDVSLSSPREAPPSDAFASSWPPLRVPKARRPFSSAAASGNDSLPFQIMTYEASFTAQDKHKKVVITYKSEEHEREQPVSANTAYLFEHQGKVTAFFAFSSVIIDQFEAKELEKMRYSRCARAENSQGFKFLTNDERILIQAQYLSLAAPAGNGRLGPCKIKSLSKKRQDTQVYCIEYASSSPQKNSDEVARPLYYFCFALDHKLKDVF